MIPRQSVQNLGSAIERALALLANEYQRKQFGEQYAQTAQGMVAPTAPRQNYVEQSPAPVSAADQPDPLAILAAMYRNNPGVAGMRPFQEQLAGAQAFAPVPFTANAGDVYGTRDRFTGKPTIQGQVPKTTPPNLPEGFSQLTDPQMKADLFNKTYGTSVPASDFATADRLVNTFTNDKNQHIGWFQKQDGSIYSKPLGDVRPPKSAKSGEQVDKLTALESNLNQYEQLLTKVPGGRIGGTVSKMAASVEQNKYARAAQGLENTLTGLIARVIAGEVGVLTDQDIERAKSMLPQITDNGEERALKLQQLRQLIDERRKAMGGQASGQTGPQQITLPDGTQVTVE